MLVIESGNEYLDKAEESLAGAESEFANSRYNNTANRAYYACFQAAIHALIQAGIEPPGKKDQWGHDFVQAQFSGQLINSRKLYSRDLGQAIIQNYRLRQTADYARDPVTEVRAARSVRRAEQFVNAVKQGVPQS